jgi:hypothetical protein
LKHNQKEKEQIIGKCGIIFKECIPTAQVPRQEQIWYVQGSGRGQDG